MVRRPLFRCDTCGTVSRIRTESVRVMPRLGQVRFVPACGCIHVRTFPPRIMADLVDLAADGTTTLDDVAPPIIDCVDGPRITVAEALEAAEDFDRWLALQMYDAS